jgi:hypothetical protein
MVLRSMVELEALVVHRSRPRLDFGSLCTVLRSLALCVARYIVARSTE